MKKSVSTWKGSRHFAVHPLAEGVFAAIASDEGAAIGNAGLVDLGGEVLVFDTFMTPQAAMDLRQAAIELFGKPPTLVVNSHYHNDHIWGNQVFTPQAQIIASRQTRELINTEGDKEYQWNAANASRKLDELRIKYRDEKDDQQRRQLMTWIFYYEGLVEALPTLSPRLPERTFEQSLVIKGKVLKCELREYKDAHTGSDVILHLKEEGIIFMGDLLFVGFHPYLADGDPRALLKVLAEIALLDPTCLVPGHGLVGTLRDIEALIDYTEHCLETAKMLTEKGNISEETMQQLIMPERFRKFKLPHMYTSNISAMCQHNKSD